MLSNNPVFDGFCVPLFAQVPGPSFVFLIIPVHSLFDFPFHCKLYASKNRQEGMLFFPTDRPGCFKRVEIIPTNYSRT